MWNKLTDKVPPYDTVVLCRGEHDVIDFKGVNHGKSPHLFLAFNQCYRPYCNMTRVIYRLSEELQSSGNDLGFFECPEFTEWMEIPS